MSREASIANLEIFLDQAVDPQKDEFDISAVDAFCHLVKNEPDLSATATKLLAQKIQSQSIKESLFALEMLEECMDTLGANFQIEVNKFKFLNELIRLVSKKFLGDKTPREIQDRILDILFTWTDKYPELSKIKEAYTMLRTQGVVHEPQRNVIAPNRKSTDNTLKLMESDKFKRLLQSKNQKDIEAANLMIQNMVRDNDRRIQIQNRRLMDLQSANENAILLKEMLDELDPSESTEEDTLSTLQEIYNNCVKLKPTVCRLAEESQESSESFVSKVLETTDVLNTTIELYTAIIINKTPVAKKAPKLTPKSTTNLLDVAENSETIKTSQSSSNGTLSELNDIFCSPSPAVPPTATTAQADSILLTPQIVPPSSTNTTISTAPSNIDIIAMINSHKPTSQQQQGDLLGNFDFSTKSPSKTASKVSEKEKQKNSVDDFESMVFGMKSKLLVSTSEEENIEELNKPANDEDDEVNLIGNEASMEIEEKVEIKEEQQPAINVQSDRKIALKDINLDIGDIQPSEIEAPRTILDEKKGLKVLVNFTQDRPAKDVIVLVISVMNQGQKSINNFQFDASVAKPCKVRILEASGRDLPGVKPFKPPTETITQVVLLLNPTQQPVNLIAILTYNLDGDLDPEKESIEVRDIPFNS